MAENTFTQLSVPLARQAINFAPRKPLEQLIRDKKPNKNPTKFDASFRAWYQEKMGYQRQSWEELYAMGQLVSLFRQGQQLLVRRPYGGGYYVRPIANDDTYRQTAMNIMGFHAQVIEAKIVSSNPKVNIRPGDDTPQAIATAQACRPIVDCAEIEFYTSKFTRREAIYLETNGMFIHRCRWNPFKGGQTVQSRQVNQVQRQTDNGFGECAECGFHGNAVDDQGNSLFQETDTGSQCPECGSNAVDVKPPSMINMSQISMGDSMPVGEPELIQTPFQGWRWDLSKDLEESPWAIYRQRITQGAINMMLGNVIIPDSQSSGDYGLDILHALNYAGQAFAGASRQQAYGYGNREEDHRPTMAECWIPPEDASQIEIDETETIGGQVIPKGKLSDWAQGCPVCVVALNDGQAVVGVYKDESHQQEVITGQWIMQTDTGAGRGMEDTAAVQKRFNAVDGQIYQGLATTATPAAITDLSIFKEDQANYLFRPGVNIDVNLALLPPGMKLSDAFHLPPAGNINQQYIQYGSKFLMQMVELSSLSVEYSDLLSIDNRTATGAQITAALANSLYGPMLATKAQARVTIAKRVIELHQTHNAASRYFAGNGNAKGRLVGAGDLKGKVIFELVQNSELPVTPYSQQNDVQVFFQAYGGAPIAAQIRRDDPEFFRATSAPFNIDWGPDDDADISTLCLSRLEQMKSGLQSGINDPVMLTESLRPPVSVKEPKHKEKSLWWSEYLDLQQGQEAPMEIRQAAELMFDMHTKYETLKAMPGSVGQGLVAGAGQAAAMAPSAIGQMALQEMGGGNVGAPDQAAQQAHEANQAQHDRELDATKTMADQQHKEKLKLMEIEGQKQITELQGKNALDTTKQAGINAVKAQKAKPKVKPKTAA